MHSSKVLVKSKKDMRILIVSIIMWLFAFPVTGQTEVDWAELVTLNTTRTELRKLLGEPAHIYANADLFFLPDQKVSVQYASGRCKGLRPHWKVKRGIVLSLLVKPMKPSKFDAKTLSAGFVRGPIQDDLSVDYTNADKGIEYVVNEFGELSLISYTPAKIAREKFKCGK